MSRMNLSPMEEITLRKVNILRSHKLQKNANSGNVSQATPALVSTTKQLPNLKNSLILTNDMPKVLLIPKRDVIKINTNSLTNKPNIINNTEFMTQNMSSQRENSNQVSEFKNVNSHISKETKNDVLNTDPISPDEKQSYVKNDKNVKCLICDIMFISFSSMQAHYLKVHRIQSRGADNSDMKIVEKEENDTSEGEPKCPMCSIFFKTKDEVKEHMARIHCYKCSECLNSFYTLFQFTDHHCLKQQIKQSKKLRKIKVKKVSQNLLFNNRIGVNSNPVLTPVTNTILLKIPEPSLVSTLSPNPIIQLANSRTTVSHKDTLNVNICNQTLDKPYSTTLNSNKKMETAHTKVNKNSLRNEPVVLANTEFSMQNTPSITNVEKSISENFKCNNISSLETLDGKTLLNKEMKSNKYFINKKRTINNEFKSKDFNLIEKEILNTSAHKPSLLDMPIEILKSKKLNEIKLKELQQNPNFTIEMIPPKKLKKDEITELYTCGRCNVICDDNTDFIRHLHYCLKLSNVSIITLSDGKSMKFLKLRSEIISSVKSSVEKTGINSKLMNQIEGSIGSEKFKTIFKDILDENEADNFKNTKNATDSTIVCQDNMLRPMMYLPMNSAVTVDNADYPVISISDENEITWKLNGEPQEIKIEPDQDYFRNKLNSTNSSIEDEDSLIQDFKPEDEFFEGEFDPIAKDEANLSPSTSFEGFEDNDYQNLELIVDENIKIEASDEDMNISF